SGVLWEAPVMGLAIVCWKLMGGLSKVGVHVTDVPTSGQPLSSPTQFLALEWGRTVHLDVTYVTSQRLAMNDPNYPNGIEMEFLATPQGNFDPGGLPITIRFECGGRDDLVREQPPVPGVPFRCHYHSDEEGSQITVTAVATVGGGFISPPDGPGLDRWKSLGCTVGSTDTELVKLPTVVACNDNQ